ncbi:putative acyl-CoA carboxylase beta subunit [Gemmatimonas aurantiaca T-27]|uniref:Putative acyl-CoA carboxylase beta subunit n=1 Tax=Gemmatimonas aurantiaca (strain DSM 14586 / JCM 11422 / NBRC 100505 / T-27) TaxID=379066 RepID=C1A939_GEMAT|nr:acyl-CoA carboxylase subunit beta [Gemmatimonas aurantiaca]BAH38749.1 putative acyl-CoA carboxylase beta subunit [Gemmatimonas aurantiaca T-27]
MSGRLRRLADELRALEAQLRQGGGPDKIEKQHKQGKLTARERVEQLADPGTPFLEIGLLIAHDRYDGQAPGAGVITGIAIVDGREVVVVANDATVKAGSWWPETITKILRAQEVAMRCRIPIIYLVDSAGVNLPYQGGVFPGQYGAARIFYYNSIMRRYLRIPQLAAVMGQCVAGGAYLPALSDVILMVKGTSFMGLGGPNLVKGATGQSIDGETLGGALTHTEVSGVAHYALDDDASCLVKLRELVARLPRPNTPPQAAWRPPAEPPSTLYDLLPADHRMQYDMHALLRAVLDEGKLDEFQGNLAKEMICGDARIEGIPVGIIANQRGLIKGRPGEKPRFGGIIYAESAEKVAYFIERCDKQGIPIIFVQDVSGFMVGPEAEHEGIIRAGAHFVEAMACARVPKIVLTVNHASGAGYYAMAGQGFDPDFILSWPTGRMAVMEGEAAVQAVHGPALDAAKKAGTPPSPEVLEAAASMRADYETQLDARYAAARGFVDTIVYPEDTRSMLALALRSALQNPGPHLGAFVLPPMPTFGAQ